MKRTTKNQIDKMFNNFDKIATKSILLSASFFDEEEITTERALEVLNDPPAKFQLMRLAEKFALLLPKQFTLDLPKKQKKLSNSSDPQRKSGKKLKQKYLISSDGFSDFCKENFHEEICPLIFLKISQNCSFAEEKLKSNSNWEKKHALHPLAFMMQ